jgi:hypothetical protein
MLLILDIKQWSLLQELWFELRPLDIVAKVCSAPRGGTCDLEGSNHS